MDEAHGRLTLPHYKAHLSSRLEMAQSNIPPTSDGLSSEWELSYRHEGRRKDATMRPVGNMGSSWGEKKEVPFSNPSSADLAPSSSAIYFSNNSSAVSGPKDELIELLASGDCLTCTPPASMWGTSQSRAVGTGEQQNRDLRSEHQECSWKSVILQTPRAKPSC